MSETDNEDRTELPTEKRLRDAREKGDVARSRELANVAVLGGGAVALALFGPAAGRASQGWMKDALSIEPGTLGQPGRLLPHAVELLAGLLLPALPLVLAALAACFIGPALMGALRFSGKALQPDFKRLNPAAGLKRMWGKEAMAELLRSLARVGIVGGVGYVIVSGAFSRLLAMPQASLEASIADCVSTSVHALLAMVGAMAVLAALDVPWQKYSHRKKLMMTKQEIRDEHKESDGNPEMKARVRQVAQQMSQRRMMEAVPTADVVVTNPTHYAVALKYEAGAMRAPKVVAKGVDEMALLIRDVAGKNRVSIVEAPPLARALYRVAKVDAEIPVKLYAAVAQVLSYVYQLKRWHPAQGPMPSLADVDLGEATADGVVDPEGSR